MFVFVCLFVDLSGLWLFVNLSERITKIFFQLSSSLSWPAFSWFRKTKKQKSGDQKFQNAISKSKIQQLKKTKKTKICRSHKDNKNEKLKTKKKMQKERNIFAYGQILKPQCPKDISSHLDLNSNHHSNSNSNSNSNGKQKPFPPKFPTSIWLLLFSFFDLLCESKILNQVNKQFRSVYQNPLLWRLVCFRNVGATIEKLKQKDIANYKRFLKEATICEFEKASQIPLDVRFLKLQSLAIRKIDLQDRKFADLTMFKIIDQNSELQCLTLGDFRISFNFLFSLQLLQLQFLSLSIYSTDSVNDSFLNVIPKFCPNIIQFKLTFQQSSVTEGWCALTNCLQLQSLILGPEISLDFPSSHQILKIKLSQLLMSRPIGSQLKFLELKEFRQFDFFNIPHSTSVQNPVGFRGLQVLVLRKFGGWPTGLNFPRNGLPNIWKIIVTQTLSDQELQSLSVCCPKLKRLKVPQFPNIVDKASFLCLTKNLTFSLCLGLVDFKKQEIDCGSKRILWTFLKNARDFLPWEIEITWKRFPKRPFYPLTLFFKYEERTPVVLKLLKLNWPIAKKPEILNLGLLCFEEPSYCKDMEQK